MKSRTEQLLMVMHILAWLVFIGLLIVAGSIIVTYFISIGNARAAKDLYKGMDLYAYRQHSFVNYTFVAGYKVLLYSTLAYIAFLMTNLLSRLNISRPFNTDVVKLMQKISYSILCVWLISLVHNIHVSILEKSYGIVAPYISGWFVFIAGIVYVLAQVFKRGVEIQSENSTLLQLKAAQAQLIQSEKMASLGELTAGVAHEIQNPLNFVNNFSEVSVELIDEMEKEFNAGNKDDGIAIASDIKQNLEKIIHHGKRADAIVKGMLQHSRKSTGQKELTDINALAEEYLRLSYHGMRAKDKFFSATLQTDFDDTIEKINIVPQDIGRVLLNLFTNAIYSVNEKKKTPGENYEPTISLTTKKAADHVEIKVKDNGSGIPQKILDKIFQPFFTTKPTGEGTGLGLSLSYDIITKAHGGTIHAEARAGEFAEFIIHLPI